MLLRNEEIVIMENDNRYILLFLQQPEIFEMHISKNGEKVYVYIDENADINKTKEAVFCALRFAYLIIARNNNIYVLHSASIEYENEEFQHLGSVVTNNGYSDWATTVIDASVKTMWYRFSRREDDYCIECSRDGQTFQQMRICHMWHGAGAVRFGIYACSPEDSSFRAVFTCMELGPCQWAAHDGQPPDEEVRAHPNK